MMKTMKRILEKAKTAVSALVLSAMVVCAAAPVLQAANNITKNGGRVYSPYGYQSFTEVSGYESNGVGLNITAGAEMGSDGMSKKTKRGTASVYSAYSGTKKDAYHAYGIGSDLNYNTRWMKN